MHAHGVRLHPQPLPLPELPRDSVARNNATAPTFSLTDDLLASDDPTAQTIDPDGSKEGESGKLPPRNQTWGRTDSSSAPIADLTVEPMIYGATGKIRFLQNKAGQRASGQA